MVHKRRERILFVEDDELLARPTTWFLEQAGYEVVYASTFQTGMAALDGEHDAFDYLVLDLGLGRHDGQDILRWSRRLPYRLPAIVLLEPPEVTAHRVASLIGRCAWLPKPVSADDLITALLACPGRSLWSYGEAYHFTPREQAVLECLAEGMEDKEIAGRLEIDVSSVQSHWRSMRVKAGFQMRADLHRDIIRWLVHGERRRASGVHSVRRWASDAPQAGSADARAPNRKRG